MRRVALVTQAVLTFWAMGAMAGDALEARLKSVENLLERSATAQRLDTGGHAVALAKRDEARRLYREAVAAHAGGDSAGAGERLDQATAAMVAAGRLAQGGEGPSEKERQDYLQRAASVEALLIAQQRIARDRGREAEAEEVARTVAALRDQAESLAAVGNHRDGRLLLDMALERAKLSLRAMKDGSTEEVRLDFETQQQWYGYYQDKTESQLRAIELLGARLEGTGKWRMVESLVTDAREKRRQAAQLAGEGRYEAANQILDKLLARLTGGLMAVIN